MKYISILIFLILTVFSCQNNIKSNQKIKNNFFYFSNAQYNEAFPEEGKINDLLNNKFQRNFYKTTNVQLKKLSNFQNDFIKIKPRVSNSIIYVNNLLLPFIITDQSLSTYQNLKVISDEIPDSGFSSIYTPVLNIKIDKKIYGDEIIKVLSKYSKSKDFSDCGFLINSNYLLPSQVLMYINKSNKKVVEFKETENLESVKTWIKNSKLKCIVMFGYNLNKLLSDNYFFNDSYYIEIETKYGYDNSRVKHFIKSDKFMTYYYAGITKEFENFINSKKLTKKIYEITVTKDKTLRVTNQ